MATGVPVSSFSGGEETNGYLQNLGFRITGTMGHLKREGWLKHRTWVHRRVQLAPKRHRTLILMPPDLLKS